MKKVFFFICLLFVGLTLSSCAGKSSSSEQTIPDEQKTGASSTEISEGQNVSVANEAVPPSADETVHSSADEAEAYSVAVLHSKEELIAYAKENIQANEYGDPALYEIECPIENYEFSEIEASGWIYYRFIPSGYKIPELPGESQDNEQTPDLYIGWNPGHNGEHGLEWFVSQNHGVVFPAENMAGVYYSDGYTADNVFIGRMYYWVEDDCFFQASVPAEQIETFQTFLCNRKQFIKCLAA